MSRRIASCSSRQPTRSATPARLAFDALGRVTAQTTPDASVTTQTFGTGGLLQAVTVNIRGAVTATDIITNLDYNARGQRTFVAHGNGSETEYTYDPRTFRVRRIHTERPNDDPDLRTVQDLRYHHDPSGNITQIRDNAQQGVFFANAYVDATHLLCGDSQVQGDEQCDDGDQDDRPAAFPLTGAF